jgi:hypothetical protein
MLHCYYIQQPGALVGINIITDWTTATTVAQYACKQIPQMARFEGFMEEKIKVEVLRNIGILRCYNSEDVHRSVWCDWKMSSSSLHVALEFG